MSDEKGAIRAENIPEYFREWGEWGFRAELPPTDEHGLHRRAGHYQGHPVDHPPYVLARLFNGEKIKARRPDVDAVGEFETVDGLHIALVRGDGKFIRYGKEPDPQHDILIPREWALPFIDALIAMRPGLVERLGEQAGGGR